jgi:RsiW-degrading membrane proteinase PrsW (M82 family)
VVEVTASTLKSKPCLPGTAKVSMAPISTMLPKSFGTVRDVLAARMCTDPSTTAVFMLAIMILWVTWLVRNGLLVFTEDVRGSSRNKSFLLSKCWSLTFFYRCRFFFVPLYVVLSRFFLTFFCSLGSTYLFYRYLHCSLLFFFPKLKVCLLLLCESGFYYRDTW